MKLKKFIFGFCLSLIGIMLPTAKSYAEQTPKMVEEKIYVTPNQLVITENQILAYLPNSPEPVSGNAIAFDANGLYVSRMVLHRGPCYIHNLWCNRCGGCGVLLCPMNCCCYN